MADVESLGLLLRDARARVSPEEHGLLPRSAGRGRRAPGLRQEDMDAILGRAEGTYARFERGALAGVTPELCRDVAEALRFTDEQWESLWIFLHSQRPPVPLDKARATLINPHWQEVAAGQQNPAYVTDRGWNLVYWNDAFEQIFPDRIVPANTMDWMILSADGRRRLVDWQTAWAPQVLPQLLGAVRQYPEDATLRRLDRDIRRDPVAGPMYRACRSAYQQPDGAVRYLLHHGLMERVRTKIAYSEPAGRPGARYIVLLMARPGVYGRSPLTAGT